MNVYRVKLEQMNPNGYAQAGGTYDVMAISARRAIDKAEKAARKEGGYLKSRPINVVSLDTLASQVL